MLANFVNRKFSRVSLRRGSGPTRGSHSCHGLEAVRCWQLELDGYAGGRERAGLDWRPGSGWVHLPSVSWDSMIPGWQLT